MVFIMNLSTLNVIPRNPYFDVCKSNDCVLWGDVAF